MSKPQDELTPLVDAWQWQKGGLCRGLESSVFFHPDGERGRARDRRIAKAKAVCRSCPVIQQCREHALTVGEPYGIWGGMSEQELAIAAQRRSYQALPLIAS